MLTFLEITGDDIALLNDTDLRSLIGLLCEADFRLGGLPTTGIIWGGHQNASDGGEDVTVRSEFDPPQSSNVPRKATIFQVKNSDMPRSKILDEMRPDDKLREEIKRLIHQHGAYIIVSSKGSTTNKALQNRTEAMQEAIANEPNHQQLCLDFLDRGRLATWVRTHPSLILWVRNKIGRPLQGWQSYGNWANTPTGTKEEYITDEKLRLYVETSSGQADAVIKGLQKLRLRLSQNGVSVRLIGLSGVGKTRLVQALFDERIGDDALTPSFAYYTDISDSPIPDPPSFASQLIATQVKSVLIIDNCSPELHRTLTKLCKNSTVSLLTVEYDIRDDIPEETDVVRLEPSSDTLIEKLLEQRYPHISPINRQTISKFSDGNARVAIALANTLERDEGLSTLRDEDLFNRLFHQRHGENDSLKVSAEICSLVYSFEGIDTRSETSELAFLAKLAGQSSNELYRNVAELKSREIVQARSTWRAVLPPAIANRLAKDALDSIPSRTIEDAFLSEGSERLIKSFTRRLGYLHDCEPAIEIAKAWLRSDGWLGATNCNFNSLGLTVFENIAPIVPEATLTMLERVATKNEGLARLHHREFIRLLRHLAYEAHLFQRCATLLSRLALLENPNTNNGDSARTTLTSLFHIVLSGTHALPRERAIIVNKLLQSNIQEEQDIGIRLLKATIETHYFRSNHSDTLGARPRDFGYRPNTNQEVADWYRVSLAICTRTAMLEASIAIRAKQVLASHLRGLWSIGLQFDQQFLDELESAIIQIHSQKAWNEGWISVKGIIRYDGERMGQGALLRLKQLAQRLEPINLLEQARTYALTDGHLNFGLEDDIDEEENASDQWKRIQDTTRQIGVAVAQDEAIFRELLPELLSNHTHRLNVFGEGLAEGCKDRKRMWQAFYQQIEKTPPEKRQIAVMLGFLSSCSTHDPDFYHLTLNTLIEDELLGQWFPYFQTTSIIDKQGLERLHKALDIGKANIESFKQLAWGRYQEKINDDDLALLLQKLLTKAGGARVVIDILSMRLHRKKAQAEQHSKRLLAVLRETLLQYDYADLQNRNDHPDYRLAQIADISLSGKKGAETASKLCRLLAEGLREYQIYGFHYRKLFESLAQLQPMMFLDAFIGSDAYIFIQTGFDDLEKADSPINRIPDDIVIAWCEQEPEIRYPLIVSSMQMYSKSKDSEELCWHPILYTIFEKSPHIKAVLLQLEGDIYPMFWSGSRADAIAKRFLLFTALFKHPNTEIQDWAVVQHQKLQQAVDTERERELQENQVRFERFE